MTGSGAADRAAHAKSGAGLVTTPNFEDPDGFYAAYVAAHRELADPASDLLNARLVLILANHIGDGAILAEALELARSSFAKSTQR